MDLIPPRGPQTREADIVYPHPLLEKILRETYGNIVTRSRSWHDRPEMAG
jgi:hypothetical protein